MPDAAAPELEVAPVVTHIPTVSPATPTIPAVEFPDDRYTDLSRGRTVLIVEDDTDFAKILYALAHEVKYQCLVASTAAEGVSMASEYVPDAILLDIGLPDTSGLSVLQKLKSTHLLAIFRALCQHQIVLKRLSLALSLHCETDYSRTFTGRIYSLIEITQK